MVAAHFSSIEACCKAVVPLMEHDLYTCEMMDKVILDCTRNNTTQAPNRFFIAGDPAAILMLELRDDAPENLGKKHEALIETLEKSGLSYAFPSLYGDDIDKALELRKAGLGLLGNMVGDKKAVACIEDTAVALDDLAAYIGEFSALMKLYGQEAVYYAHAGAGELHLRPILNLKKDSDVELFRKITTDVARLVKKYNGALSGEHGDGIVRSEFIKMMIGDENYRILQRIKTAFDPDNIFNPGKITDPFPMDASLRYTPGRSEPRIPTLLDFSDSMGILRAAEKCNGSGDCRKTHHARGAMCPSYHATKDEKDTTRARANALREFLTHSGKKNRFDHTELKEVFELCLACKACSSECPSNVDVAALKTEFLYQYRQANGTTLQDKAFAYTARLNALSAVFPGLSNAFFSNSYTGRILKKLMGIAPERDLPRVARVNFDRFLNAQQTDPNSSEKVVLYIDEFTRYSDTGVGKDAIALLCRLGYRVELFYGESGRALISKGFLEQARKVADRNIEKLSAEISDTVPLVGIEPSALLSFRDEYLRLATDKKAAATVARHSFLIEEFLSGAMAKGHVRASQFTGAART
ncbi:MAG: 4Fe-4S dicluster domain-containing protein, partial [Sinomicrobium sp.]|nr:4Fe-4S dicluster domain-containing protein [Sinomicrobium sp.]